MPQEAATAAELWLLTKNTHPIITQETRGWRITLTQAETDKLATEAEAARRAKRVTITRHSGASSFSTRAAVAKGAREEMGVILSGDSTPGSAEEADDRARGFLRAQIEEALRGAKPGKGGGRE